MQIERKAEKEREREREVGEETERNNRYNMCMRYSEGGDIISWSVKGINCIL